MKSFFNNTKVILIVLLKYSGILFIIDKFYPLKNHKNLPNGTIWFLGIYFSVFTIALNQHSNRGNEIENRITTLLNFAIQKQYVSFFSTIKRVNNMRLPVKPELAWPFTSPFKSLFGNNIRYQEGYGDLKNILKEVNQKLEGIELRRENLNSLDFSFGNLKNTRLYWIQMNSCIFFQTDFSNAWMVSSKIKNSYLAGTILPKTKLINSQFKKSYLLSVNLMYSDLSQTNFDSCYITYSDFSNTNLNMTSFDGAIIFNSKFIGSRNLNVHNLIKAKTLFGIEIEKKYLDEIMRLKPQLLDSIESIKYKSTALDFWGSRLCPDIEYSNARQ